MKNSLEKIFYIFEQTSSAFKIQKQPTKNIENLPRFKIHHRRYISKGINEQKFNAGTYPKNKTQRFEGSNNRGKYQEQKR